MIAAHLEHVRRTLTRRLTLVENDKRHAAAGLGDAEVGTSRPGWVCTARAG